MKESREALRLEPNRETNYLNLGGLYMALNRPDEAEAVYNEAQERKLEGEILLGNRYALAFLKGDAVQMAQLVSSARESRVLRIVVVRASGHGSLVRQV